MDRNGILSALAQALSREPERIYQANLSIEDAFRGANPGFLSLWINIIHEPSIDPTLRLLAATQARKEIERAWLRLAFPKEEKESAKTTLLHGLFQLPRLICLQTSVSIARIAYCETPDGWPECIPFLLDRFVMAYDSAYGCAPIQEAVEAKETVRRALETLKGIFKKLEAKVIGSTRRWLVHTSPAIFDVILPRAQALFQRALGALHAERSKIEASTFLDLEIGNLAIRVCRNLIIAGFPAPTESHQAVAFVSFMAQLLTATMDTMQAMPFKADHDQEKTLHRTLILPSKTFLTLQRHSMSDFFKMPAFEEIITKYWSIVNNQQSLPIRMRIHSLLILKGIITAHAALAADSDDNAVRDYTATAFFTPERTLQFARTLVTRYLVLTNEDLQEWTEAPESWTEEQDALDWEYHVRACAEKTLADLFIPNKGHLSSWLIQEVLPTVTAATSVDKLEKVIEQDAYLSVIGIASLHAADAVPYGRLIDEYVWPLVASKALHPVLRRRMTLIISSWAHIDQEPKARSRIWAILNCLLQSDEGNDLVVRTSVIRTLATILGQWTCQTDDVLPVMEPIFHAMIDLLCRVEMVATKLRILNTMTAVVQKVGPHIAQSAGMLLRSLPLLWQSAGDQQLLCATIIVTLNALVAALKDRSPETYPLLIPLLEYTLKPSLAAESSLQGDALKLWSSAVQHAPQAAAKDLIPLLPLLWRVFEVLLDSVRHGLNIAQGYILLAPCEILITHGVTLFKYYGQMISDPSSSSTTIQLIVRNVGTAITISPADVCNHVIQESQFLTVLLKVVREDGQSPINATSLLQLIARIAVVGASAFENMIKRSAGELHESSDSVWQGLISVWLDKFPNVAEAKNRKLLCMGLNALLQIDQHTIIHRLLDVIQIWSDVLHEVRERFTGDAVIYWEQEDTVWADDEALDDDEYGDSAESQRRALAQQSDPVHCINLALQVRATLESMKANPHSLGAQALNMIDPAVLADIEVMTIVDNRV